MCVWGGSSVLVSMSATCVEAAAPPSPLGSRIVEKKKIIPLSIHPPLLSLLHLRHKNEKRKAKIFSSEFSHGARARHFPSRNSDLKFSKSVRCAFAKKGHSLEKCKGEGGGVLRLFLFFPLLKKRPAAPLLCTRSRFWLLSSLIEWTFVCLKPDPPEANDRCFARRFTPFHLPTEKNRHALHFAN